MSIVKYDREGKVHTVNESTTTKYDGKVFDRLLEHFKNGGSTPEFCREEGICRNTLDNWLKKYDPHKRIKPMAKLWAEGWWMLQARQNLLTYSSKEEGSSRFDAKIYLHTVGGRFGQTSNKEMVDLIKKVLAIHEQQKPMAHDNLGYAETAEYELIEEKNENKNENKSVDS